MSILLRGETQVRYGFHPSPFGIALVMATDRGLAGLAFADAGAEQSALADMSSRWPKAWWVGSSACRCYTCLSWWGWPWASSPRSWG